MSDNLNKITITDRELTYADLMYAQELFRAWVDEYLVDIPAVHSAGKSYISYEELEKYFHSVPPETLEAIVDEAGGMFVSD